MDTGVVIILVIAVLIVLAIAAYLIRQQQARRVEERREEAAGTREEARASERRAEQARTPGGGTGGACAARAGSRRRAEAEGRRGRSGRRRRRGRRHERRDAARMSETILFDRDQVERLDDLGDRPRRLNRGSSSGSTSTASRRRTPTRLPRRSGSIPGRASVWRARPNARSFTTMGATSTSPPTRRTRATSAGELRRARCVVSEQLGHHRAQRSDPGPRGVRGARVRLRRHGSLDGPGFLAGSSSGCSGRTPPPSSESSSGWRSSTSRRCAATARRKRTSNELAQDAQGGRQAPACARGAPDRARVAHPPGARGARPNNKSGERFGSLLSRFRVDRCKRRAMRARRSSAPSTS